MYKAFQEYRQKTEKKKNKKKKKVPGARTNPILKDVVLKDKTKKAF